ncbi:MAG: membrane protein insertion efficiency factor YidD [Leptospirales bacterium]|nr:membrane protein insertion efficiency factor YidD [Leptospirales bacterium]
MNPANRAAIAMIRGYRGSVGLLMPGRCRFYPSCSHYGEEAFATFGFWKAFGKTALRIARCNPLSEGYFDPVVPEAQKRS